MSRNCIKTRSANAHRNSIMENGDSIMTITAKGKEN